MPTVRRSLFLVLCLLLSVPLAAQITGSIVDSTNRTPLNGARVLLTRTSDSLRAGALTAKDGSFTVNNVQDGTWSMQVTFVGYRTHRRTIRVQGAPLSLGTIVMSNTGIDEKEVVVTDKALLAVQKGDTVEMNANAYKTSKDASAEDLVQKMPGVTIQDGRIQAQGEQVQQVLVDGRQFFGDDPNAALRNLPAEMIDKVQVFDQGSDQSKFSGLTDANSRKTLNIVTKRSMRNGQFGRLYAGYGDDGRYKAGGVMNIFDNARRITILAQTNNINEQNFAIEDLVGAMSGGQGGGGGGMRRMGNIMGAMAGGGGRRPGGGGPMGGIGDFLVNQSNGITTTHALGVNYADQWSSDVDVTASYFFNWSNNDANQDLFRQFVLPGATGQTYNENTETTSRNINHRLNARLEARLDSMQSIVWRPRASLQVNNGSSLLNGANTLGASPLNTTTNDFASQLDGYNINNDLLYRLAFAEPGRTFSASVNVTVNKNTGDNSLHSLIADMQNPDASDTIDQRSNLDKNGLTVTPTLTYTEPLSTVSFLALTATASLASNESDKRTFKAGAVQNVYDNLDTTLTNTFKSQYNTYSVQPTYRYNVKDFETEVGVAYQIAQLKNDQQFPVTSALDRTFRNILPTASFRYNISQDQNLRLNYRTRTSSPSVDQLQDVINNTNPVQLTTGDPNLRQDFSHNVFLRYSANNVDAATTFFAMIGGGVTEDYVGNSVTIARSDTTVAPGIVLPRGGQLQKPVNLDGYANLRGFFSYGLPVGFISSNLNLFGSLNYTRTPGLINGVENVAHTPMAGLGVVISSNISEDVDFTASTSVNASWVRNTARSDQNGQYLNGLSRLRLNWRFFEGFVWSTDVNNTLTSGYSAGYDRSVWLWNMGLAYKFLENDRAEIRLSVADILRQNTSIQRTVSESYTEDVQANLLQRYALLTFTYNIRNFPGMSGPQR